MLLSRLVDYARISETVTPPQDAAPMYYMAKTVRWVLDLTGDGRLASNCLTDLADAGDRARKNGATHTIPSVTKTSGIAPTIAVDTGEYLFGWVSDGAKPTQVARVGRQHAAFHELVNGWTAADPGGPARALQTFLRSGEAGRLARPDTWSRTDLASIFRMPDVLA